MDIPSWLQPVLTALEARLAWAVLAFTASGIFGAYVKDRHRFAGQWYMEIRWTPSHAKKLVQKKDVVDPYSVGEVAITYGHGPDKKAYWGLAYFELFCGTVLHARLCVELADMEVSRQWFSRSFPFFLRSELKNLHLRSRIREKAIQFNYGAWAQYRMEFDTSTSSQLKGHMVLAETGERVGEVFARRTAGA